MKWFLMLLLCLSLFPYGCAGHTLKYGYLPGGDYKYYAPNQPVDLKGKHYRLDIIDARNKNTIRCVQSVAVFVPRDTELEGSIGYEFFNNYFRAMIEANNGVVDVGAENVIKTEINVLSGDLKGFAYGRVFGFVEFKVEVLDLRKTYCSVMADGDEDAPVGKYSFGTRKGAFRKLVSGSTRRALEEFMHDLVRLQN